MNLRSQSMNQIKLIFFLQILIRKSFQSFQITNFQITYK